MSLDLLAAGLLAAFVALGACRGALASGAGLVSLVVAYGAAVVAGGTWGASAAEGLGVSPLIGAAGVGMVAFFGAWTACGALASWLRRWDPVTRDGAPRSVLDRGLGGVFGALRGALVVLLVAWFALWLDAARGVLTGSWIDVVPETSQSRVAGTAGQVVEAAVEGAVGDGRAARVAARMAARPRESIESLQALLDDERIRAIQEDGFFWTLVENGASRRAVGRASFAAIADDEAMRERLGGLGVVSEGGAGSAAGFRAEVAEALDEVGPRLRGLRRDPELHALAEDPQVIAMLESGDTLGLLQHEGVRRLASRVGAGL